MEFLKYKNHSFCMGIDDRLSVPVPYISRHAPYDLTNYHWARKTKSTGRLKRLSWNIYRSGKFVAQVNISPIVKEPEELQIIMEHLLHYDEKAGLKPRIDHT